MSETSNSSIPAKSSGLPSGDALSIVLVYAVFASLWILLSDMALEWIFRDPSTITLAATLKGGVFVLVTSLLLYGLMQRLGGARQDTALDLPHWRPSLPFVLMILAILILTAVLVGRSFIHQRDKEVAGLKILAEIKSRQLADWLHERQMDAEFIHSSQVFPEQYRRWRLEGEQASGNALQARLEQFVKSRGVAAVLLLDEGGGLLWDSSSSSAALAPPLKAAAGLAAQSGKVRMVAPYADADGTVHLDFVAPLSEASPRPPLVVLRLDPKAWLFPTLQSSPTSSSSLETVLFRRDGEQILFLNELRKRQGVAVSLNLPVASKNLLSAKALRGEVRPGEMVEGEDYRGVAALAVLQAVPGTDWWLLTKMDRAEVYADAIQDGIWISLVGLLALFVAIAVTRLQRQRQQLAIVLSQQQSQTERLNALRLLAAISDSSEDAIFAKDLEGRYILFNRAASLFIGKPVEAVLGQDDRAIFPAEQAESLMATGRRVIAEKKIYTQEEVLSTPDGERTFQATKGPLRDGEGKLIGIFGISRDISGQKHVEFALRESEERYRLAFRTSPDAININRLSDGLYLDVNDGFERVTGWTRNEVVGRSSQDIAVWHDPVDRQRLLDALNINGYCENLPAAFVMRDGTLRDCLMSAHRIQIDGETCILSITRDITANARAERALRESEQRFHDIAQVSADWIWEVDATGHFTYVSDSVQKLLGYTPEEILGKTPFDFMPPQEAARVGSEFTAIVAARQSFHDLDNTNVHKDGSLRHVLTSGTPILDMEGRFLGYRGLDRDDTARKLAEATLLRQTAELKSRNEELERFNRAMVGREMDMIGLKQVVNELSLQLGRERPFALGFLDDAAEDAAK